MLNICSHGAGSAFGGHNSKALIDGTKYTSFGGYTWKTNAISLPKSYLKQNPHGRRPLTSEIWWPHHETCALYNEPLESSYHHCLACPFAQVVWFQVLSWEHFDTLADWWENTLLSTPCGTYERSATTGSSTQLMPRSPSCWKDQGKSRPK